MRQALKQDIATGWTLYKYSETKYFKNSRANLHIKVQYCIENDACETGIFWIQTKTDANREWARFKKSGFTDLNGTTIRSVKGA